MIVAAKGGGRRSQVRDAAQSSDSIVDWVLKDGADHGRRLVSAGHAGIGIGGTAEKAMLLANEALMEPIDIQDLIARGHPTAPRSCAWSCEKGQRARHRRPGPGGLTTVLDIKVSDYPTHAANLPVGDDPELRGHPPRTSPSTAAGPGDVRSAALDWPQVTWDARQRAAA